LPNANRSITAPGGFIVGNSPPRRIERRTKSGLMFEPPTPRSRRMKNRIAKLECPNMTQDGEHQTMPYALFCEGAKLSKTYPTEADVWERARQSGLLVDVASADDEATPRSVFENDYEIRPCPPDRQEDLAENEAEAEWRVEMDFMACWAGGDSGQVILANASALSRRSAVAWKRAVAMRVRALARAAWDSSKPHFVRPS
jgi:hypothetical protein